MTSQISSASRGQLTELTVASYFVSLGWQVYFAFGNDAEVDLVVLKGSRSKRIQIKTVYECNDVLRVNIHKDGKPKYSPDSVDTMACVFNDRIWLIPMEDIENETTLNFGRPDGSPCVTRGNFNHAKYEV